MRNAKFILVVGGCLLLALLWYWRTYLTYDGEVSHFEAKVRRQVNPDDLRAWASNLVATCSTSQVAEASFPIAMFPDYLRGLHRLPPSGFVFPTTPDRQGYVRVIWGSGFRGHWGLHVGSTNYIDAYGSGSQIWKPGVYFWRDYRRGSG